MSRPTTSRGIVEQMSSQQKRGFHLPWGAERSHEGDAVLDATTVDGPAGEEQDDLGDGPFGRADDVQDMTTDAAPAATDEPDESPEAAMFDAEAPTPESAVAPPDGASGDAGVWPSADRRGPDRPFAPVQPTNAVVDVPRMPRRDNPLVAGLVKAMREAAVASRAETTARLTEEAAARVEAIRARGTTEAAELRKRSDEDVSAIREWSKAEIARIRQETEERIEARKSELASETERHAASVDRMVEEVQSTVSAFEADMDRFFTELLAETDPARLATLAEQAPDPPDLRGDGPAAADLIDEDEDEPGLDADALDESEAETSEGQEADAPVESEAEASESLEADAAAEAEAAASEGLEPAEDDAWPTAATVRQDPAPDGVDANGPDSTRLLVSGLTSVAGISAFKGALAQLDGVRSVSVSSGEKGVFVFAVKHGPGVDLDSGIASLEGFAAHVTDATDDGFIVDAHEPAA